jgi:hypothetical protein
MWESSPRLIDYYINQRVSLHTCIIMQEVLTILLALKLHTFGGVMKLKGYQPQHESSCLGTTHYQNGQWADTA